jgi:hypothetical protein
LHLRLSQVGGIVASSLFLAETSLGTVRDMRRDSGKQTSMNQRGFIATPLIYLIAAGVAVAALAGLYWKVSHDGYERGKAEVTSQWQAANAKAEQAEAARQSARRSEAQAAAASAARSSAVARDYEARWRAATAKLARSGTLATCAPAPSGLAETKTDGQKPPGVGVLFTPDFVRQWNSAWIGADGKCVHCDTGKPADGSAKPGPAPR